MDAQLQAAVSDRSTLDRATSDDGSENEETDGSEAEPEPEPVLASAKAV